MLKKLALLAVSTLAAAAFKKYWNRKLAEPSTAVKPSHRDAVHRWEDEGGMVPTAATQAKPATQRRRSPSKAATNTAA